ncbi:MAG: DUF364 domain-containing protein [Deltaproteobacteria bacterium]|nr:DUF364 domain-containing protein [Deltaproteobacteria bacterium]
MAAINSSLDVAAFKNKFTKENAAEIMVEKGTGKNAAVIGHFPFVNRFRKKNIFKNLWVFELSPKDEQDLSPEMFSEYLPQTDVLMITATSIVNKTFSKIMQYVSADSFNIMLGPTTPLNPLLFDFNIDVLSGAVPADNKLARTWFSQGSKYRETKGIEFVSLRKDRFGSLK